MDRHELVRLYPRLFHMAAPGAWSSISAHGLLSTQALLDLFEVQEPLRARLLTEHRPSSVVITHPTLGTAVVRDQKPLRPAKLASSLQDGMTVPQWLGMLNRRVFFWLQPQRLDRLLSARAYRASDHLVLTVDTAMLLDSLPEHAVTLSRINSGSTIYVPVPRGDRTFLSIEDYPHPTRRKALATANDIAELCVCPGVGDVRAVALAAELRGPSGHRLLWSRP